MLEISFLVLVLVFWVTVMGLIFAALGQRGFSVADARRILSMFAEQDYDFPAIQQPLQRQVALADRGKLAYVAGYMFLSPWLKLRWRDYARLYTWLAANYPNDEITNHMRGKIRSGIKNRLEDRPRDSSFYSSDDMFLEIDRWLNIWMLSALSVAIILLVSVILIIHIQYPDGWVGVAASVMVRYCQATGVCDWPAAYSAFAVAVVILTIFLVYWTYSILLVCGFFDHHDANSQYYMQRQNLEHLNSVVLDIRDHLRDIHAEVYMRYPEDLEAEGS